MQSWRERHKIGVVEIYTKQVRINWYNMKCHNWFTVMYTEARSDIG